MKRERQRLGWSLQVWGYHANVQRADISKIEWGICKPYPNQAQRLRVRHVRMHHDGLASEFFDLGGSLLGTSGIDVSAHNAAALLHQTPGYGTANASGTTRNQYHVIGQLHEAFSSPYRVN
jgi:hypothetical protein